MQKPLLHNQSLLDYTLHRCGNIEQLLDLAFLNNKSITDSYLPNTMLDIPTSGIDNEVVSFFERKGHVPASGQNLENFSIDYGIGLMIIEDSFIVV